MQDEKEEEKEIRRSKMNTKCLKKEGGGKKMKVDKKVRERWEAG